MSQIQPVINLVNQALAALGMSYTNTLYGTFTDANGNTWQVDATSRALMTGTEAKIAGGMVLPVNFSWLNLANVAVPMTADQFQALTAAMFAWTQAMFSQYQAQKTAISALTTIKAVQTYQIPAWPTSTSFSIPNAAVSNAAPASNASTTPMSSGS
jgi:GH24 family phage-related lysozyme (muramidase)